MNVFTVRRMLALAAAVHILAGVAPAAAQDATALAKQTQNPISSLISVPLQGNWDFDIGDRDATAPLLFNVSKVAMLGKRPVNFLVGAGPTVASPTGGANWRFRLAAIFLFPR